MEKTYELFGMIVRVHYGKSNVSEIISNELEIYPSIDLKPEDHVDKEIYILSDDAAFKDLRFGRNPKIQFFNKKLVGYSLGIAKVFWNIDNNKDIYFVMNDSQKGLMGSVRKFRDIQFSYREEWAGQAFHESLLVNTMAFVDDMFVLHGSSMATRDGKVVLIGGTGGSGKTSTVLSLGKRKDMFFICDDICPVRADGRVFPNYAYPKIYAYNTIGNKDLSDKVLANAGFMSRFQWKVRKHQDPASVRRRMSPNKLFNIMDKDGIERLKMHSYYMLNRSEDLSKFSVRKMNIETAIDTSMLIIRNELYLFFNQLSYSMVNALYAGDTFRYDSNDIINHWKDYMRMAFEDVCVYQVDVPFDYDNELLKSKMTKIITENLGMS